MEDFDDSEYLTSYDPRDTMLGDFIYGDPAPITVERMIGSDFCWMDAGLEQLLVAEMIGYGWLVENHDGSISLSDVGRSFVESRLEKKPAWSDYAVRPDAPSLPEMSNRLKVACRAFIQRYPDNPLWQGFEKNLNAQTH
jgi:hypothetical protein